MWIHGDFCVRTVRNHCQFRYLITYLLTYSVEQSPSWEANQFSTSQEILGLLRNLKVHYHIHKCPPPVPIYRSISPVPRHMCVFLDCQFLRWEVVSTLPNSQAGGSLLVRCPWPLIQYICSYPPYWRLFPYFSELVQWNPYFIKGLKWHFTLFSTILSDLDKIQYRKCAQKFFSGQCEFHENWSSGSHTLLSGINEFLAILGMFIVLGSWNLSKEICTTVLLNICYVKTCAGRDVLMLVNGIKLV